MPLDLEIASKVQAATPEQCESSHLKKKTEIVSNGMSYIDDDKHDRVNITDKSIQQPTQSITSWVVDMSDCQNRSKQQQQNITSSSSTRTSSSAESTVTNFPKTEIEKIGFISSQKGGIGFYVPLSDVEAKLENIEQEKSSINNKQFTQSLNEKIFCKKSTGFYVDLSESENSCNATPPPSASSSFANMQSSSSSKINHPFGNDKKNISMFIDLGGNDKSSNSKEHREFLSLPYTLSDSTRGQQKLTTADYNVDEINNVNKNLSDNSDSPKEEARTSCVSDENQNSPIENELQQTPSSVLPPQRISEQNIDCNKSWNISLNECNNMQDSISKNSSSLSEEKEIMNILGKVPLITKTSNLSIDSHQSLNDITSCSKSDTSTYSNNMNYFPSLPQCFVNNEDQQKPIKKYRKDVKSNETFDKSSSSQDTSSPESITDTKDSTLQQDDNYYQTIASDSLSTSKETSRMLTMQTIMEAKEILSTNELNSSEVQYKQQLSHRSNESLLFPARTLEHSQVKAKQKQLFETIDENNDKSLNFVKLSDMDKPATKFELYSTKSFENNRQIGKLFHDSSTTMRPYSWVMTRSTENDLASITSSVENLRSISRLFPHLTKEFSNSLPSDVSHVTPHHNISLIENDFLQSDISAESSLASSFSRSGMDESSLSCRQPRRLGEDLLKMFLQEIATDVIVEVNGRRIKAHKCILRSRCQYFAAMLAGGWVQSAGNVISLPEYSYSAVHFALCHIYSGASHPPDGISLMELAALADLLGLEGLKEVTAHALKINYCHNFHKPCSGCVDGILQVLPVALNHALDDLYRKCLKWTCRYYLKVWPTRSFAQMPTDILSRCKQQVMAHLASETVLQTILDCDRLLSQLNSSRWAIPVENLVRDILDASFTYITDHFANIIASDSFLSLGHDKSDQISLLENTLLRIASSLNSDQACRSYQRIVRLKNVLAKKVAEVNTTMQSINLHDDLENATTFEKEMEWNEEFIKLVFVIYNAIERCLVKQYARALRTTSWQRLDLELRKKIQKLVFSTESYDIRSQKFNLKSNSLSNNNKLQNIELDKHVHSKLTHDAQFNRQQISSKAHLNDRILQYNQKEMQINTDTKDNLNKTSKFHSKLSTSATATKRNENSTVMIHRRLRSDDLSSFSKLAGNNDENHKKSLIRFSHVQSRYLEPRKQHSLAVKNPTKSNIPSMKGKRVSSSDSSTTYSPITNKRITDHRLIKQQQQLRPKSTNSSLSNLNSSALLKKSNQMNIDKEISADSSTTSIRSNSIRTNKTSSQKSLSSNHTIYSNTLSNKSGIKLTKTSSASSTTATKNKKTNLLHQNTSESSPSSLISKSSRLTSTASSVDSPENVFKSRSSIPNNVVVQKSFFTPKSREILARKSARQNITSNNEKKSTTTTTATAAVENTKNKQPTTSKTVLKCSSTSNIPTRRSTINSPSTLHLRKTLNIQSNTDTSSKRFNDFKFSSNNLYYSKEKLEKNQNTNINAYTNKNTTKMQNNIEKIDIVTNVKEEEEDENEKDEEKEQTDEDQYEIEPRLERSSTFCMESSDLPINEIQIID